MQERREWHELCGYYYLEIWVSEKPFVYSIRDDNQAYTDIAPILLP